MKRRLALLGVLASFPVSAQPVDVSRPPYPKALMDRAAQMAAVHDISGARQLWEAAADQGVAAAALALGQSYDPHEIARAHSSLSPDRARAEFWYQRATQMGDARAASLLQALTRN